MSKKEKEKNIEAEEAAEIQADSEKETAEESTCEKELADTKEQLLRITAEYANFRKRSEKEKQDTFVFAKSETIKELLPVIDNLERALANDKEDFDGLKKGVEMTFDSLIAILNKIGVEIFGTPGDEFNPNLHNAVMHIEDENYKNGEIVDVFQKGYKINDKIIRPAMVKSAN
ncbi:MAG: nucleotide exchange factor GrpE [Eubacterium sp.]